MRSGYCFEMHGVESWETCSNELWEIVIYTPTGSESILGQRMIDGTWCTVWKCEDGKIRAQVARTKWES